MELIKNNIEHSDYTVERLDRSRLKDLAHLYRTVYGSLPKENYFLKKYDTAFAGLEYIGYLAYNREGMPIAYYGVMPCFIQFNDQIILAAQSGDTMTHPRYRNHGLFIKLATLTYKLCKDNGVLLVFGFPNQNSHHGLVKLGWNITENMARFTIRVNCFPIEALLKRFRWSKWVYKKYIRWALRRHLLAQKGLPNSSIANGFAGVARDNRYQEYKSYSDTYVTQLRNAKAWIKIKDGMSIGDLELGDDNFNLIIASLKQLARKLGISQISFQVSPGTYLHSLFAKEFEPIPSFPIGLKDLGVNKPLDKIKFTLADIDIF